MIVGIIPARYGSERFPGKVLAKLAGKTMIQHVYERASQCKRLEQVVVATDDQRVMDEVEAFGGTALLTSTDHRNGTERCAEVARQLTATHYVNVQGDEPLIEPNQIDTVCHLLEDGAQIATLKKQIHTQQELLDPNVVKVVTAQDDTALYFSRSIIPYPRVSLKHAHFRHLGLYGFEAKILQEIVRLPPTPLEQSESLEQLRWREHGYIIKVGVTQLNSIGVDTPEDLEKVKLIVNERKGT